MDNAAPLAGQTVLVAGASSGMGEAVALRAALAGAKVMTLARRADRLEAIAREIGTQAPGTDIICIPADAADSTAVKRAIDGLVERGVGIDIMVNAVGTNIVDRAFGQLTPQSWDEMMAANLTAAFNLTHAVVPLMRARGAGLIIHIASTAARRADKSGAAYQASKAGVVALAHAVMEEERENGIRVTAILPGMTNTSLLDKRPVPVTEAARAAALQPDDIADTCLFVMSLPKRAHVCEIMIQPAGA